MLAEDPTSYVSANNLAVMLADEGRTREAVQVLESALAVKPDYAIGWHNLGELRGKAWSLTALRESQGALARSAELDHGLRGMNDGLIVDTKVYRSNLDVSRPLSPDWSYATSAGDRSHGLAITLILLLILRALWALGLDRIGGSVAERFARYREGKSRRHLLWARHPARWALGLSVLVLAWPAFRTVGGGPAELLSLAAVVTLVLMPLTLRRLLVSSPPDKLHFSWPPAMVVSAVTAPLGMTFVPFPSLGEATTGTGQRVVRWVAPTSVGVLAGVSLVAAAATSVPLARVVALASLALVASMLTPVPPFDGANLRGRIANGAINGALAVATVGVALQWF